LENYPSQKSTTSFAALSPSNNMKNTFLASLCLGVTLLLVITAKAQPTDPAKTRAEILLAQMSLEQKIGQTSLRGTSSKVKGVSEELKENIRKGLVGAVLNIKDTALALELQKIAVEESPLHIPLLFGRDVIHGYKTIFPIPLGIAATWQPSLAEKSSQLAANEAYSRCINWTFAPMIDISRDARWGRIAESCGEDPFLTSLFAEAHVKGFQGNYPLKPGHILACAKHFAAYGAAEGGRDYNTVNMSEQLLRDVYLPPFKAAAKAGVATFMTSFNDVNGLPSSGNPFLLKNVLRDEWQYDGFVVSDWNSVTEMIAHGFCADEKEAALKAAQAGLDMEMTSKAYENHVKSLIEKGKLSMTQLDNMVRNILYIKLKMGLFDNPYFKDRGTFKLYAPASLALAKEVAEKSCVLLKNEKQTLPLSVQSKIAVIGPLANAPKEQLGTWIFDGEKEHSQTPVMSIKANWDEKNVHFARGLNFSRDKSTQGFAEAIKAAKKSDVVLFFGGEEAILSGEAHSRADISLPGAQEALIMELTKTKTPIVLVILAGRPISIERILPYLSAVVMAWHPGTMAGPAITDLLLGKADFVGRLPITWPKNAGQIPIYYNHPNTGRPAESSTFVGIDSIPIEAWQSSLGNNSHYLDAGFIPQFPFGFGLSYTSFSYQNLRLDKQIVGQNDSILIHVDVTNTGKRNGTETVQLYVRDKTGSLVRPVKELKAFRQCEIMQGKTQDIRFAIAVKDLGFHNAQMVYQTEPGLFQVFVGANSSKCLEVGLEVR
jgi:beta-glucosidase